MARIFAYIIHKNGVADDSAAELAAAASKVDAHAACTAIVIGSGSELDSVCAAVQPSFAEVWKISNAALAYPNAELIRKALVRVVPAGSIVLVAHDHFAIDLAPGLSVKLNAAFVPDVVGIDGVDGHFLKLVRQEFGGQVSAHVKCDASTGAVITIRPGAFKAVVGPKPVGVVLDKSAEIGSLTAGRHYLETIVAESSDVDITKHAVLVSIGRGIQEKDNVGIAHELAEALGAAVSCSRPVVDAKWLEKSRQVGSSGKTVKPKVYLACGISGAIQHIAGCAGAKHIIAINTDPGAPILAHADYAVIGDLKDVIPALITAIKERR
jgi:electron transfer flavoprotein alpha subunit